jgi:hypothetical protein
MYSLLIFLNLGTDCNEKELEFLKSGRSMNIAVIAQNRIGYENVTALDSTDPGKFHHEPCIKKIAGTVEMPSPYKRYYIRLFNESNSPKYRTQEDGEIFHIVTGNQSAILDYLGPAIPYPEDWPFPKE